VPVIAGGLGSTVIVVVAIQPVDKMYDIVVVPALIPVARPVETPMVAIAGVLLLHVPPGMLLLSEVELPLHSSAVPVIAPGTGFTVTEFVE
jgi:hypothetical protein